jgi:uncharacterized membrane protein YphA (DoxX/SURF4 family)
MSDDGPEWFAPKRFGYGAGLPIRWQGWALTAGFLAASLLIAVKLRARPVQAIAALVPLVAAFVVIASKTTRGGWRWRWGDDEN